MNRELVASVVTALLPLALIALTAFAARAASVAVRYIHDRRLALAVELAAYGAAGVVADLMQHVVRDLKDPAKPGAWNDVAAAAVRLRAVARMRELYPSAVRVLEQAADDPKRVDDLLATLVERAVVDLKTPPSSPSPLVAVSESGDREAPQVTP